MILRGIDFRSVWSQSGAQGFAGEGYPLHKILRWFGLTFHNCTMVGKTTTVDRREGKMPLKKDGLTPREFKPKCIVVKFFKGVVLNAVSLSGFGLKFLLDLGAYQTLRSPFMMSFMSLETTRDKRLEEARKFVCILKPRLWEFYAPFAVQANESCPNHEKWETAEEEFIQEVHERLDILSELEVPLGVKLGLNTPVSTAKRIAEHPHCDFIVIPNTVIWGTFPEEIDWQGLFGSMISPLKGKVGLDGGLSGEPLKALTVEWLLQAQKVNFPKPIAAGGGILAPRDVDPLVQAGAQAICIGCITILRPWRVQKTIDHANRLFAMRK